MRRVPLYNPETQYLDTVIRYQPPMPEVDLWLTCIAQAVFNAVNKQDVGDLSWIYSDRLKPCSFLWLCEHLAINAESLRESVNAAIIGDKEVMTSYHVVKHFTDRHWTADRRGKGDRTPKARTRLRLQRQ